MPLDFIKQEIYLAVDNVVFSIYKGELLVLLVERIKNPGKWSRALPWWFVEDDKTLKQSAYNALERKTQIKNVYLEQLYTFSATDRDPRARVVSSIYMAIVHRQNIKPLMTDEAPSVEFFPVKKLPKLAFDHNMVLEYALQRLQYKLEYTNVAQYFLPDLFSLRELQDVYELVMNNEFDVRNFRKKLHSLHMIRQTWELQTNVNHRPAKLYEFVDKEIKVFDVLGVS